MTDQVRHWTYGDSVLPEADLEQGDILRPTAMLRKVFQEIHPHFTNPKYLGFLVITQSCDLVRRDGKLCDARYINVAAIRLLDHVLLRLLDSVCDTIVSGVYLEESRGKAENLIARIVNQNEQNLGIFYLHPEASIGINEPAVGLLRISVALRVDHYKSLQQSRIGRLGKEFRAKLGWLVGNMYSRVGTEDWSEPKGRRDAQKELIKQILETATGENRPLWISRNHRKAAERAGVDVTTLTRDNIVEVLAQYKPTPRAELAATAAKHVLKSLLATAYRSTTKRHWPASFPVTELEWYGDLAGRYGAENIEWARSAEFGVDQDEALTEKFFTRLRNDPVFSSLFK